MVRPVQGLVQNPLRLEDLDQGLPQSEVRPPPVCLPDDLVTHVRTVVPWVDEEAVQPRLGFCDVSESRQEGDVRRLVFEVVERFVRGQIQGIIDQVTTVETSFDPGVL